MQPDLEAVKAQPDACRVDRLRIGKIVVEKACDTFSE
jgi:hypothetical protein